MAKNLNENSAFGYDIKALVEDLQKEGVFGLRESSKIPLHSYKNLNEAEPKEVIEAMYNLSSLSEEEILVLTLFSILPETTIEFIDLVRFSFFSKESLKEILQNLYRKGWIERDKSSFKINFLIASIIRAKNKEIISLIAEPLIDALIDDLDYEGAIGVVKDYNKALKALNYATTLLEYIDIKSYSIVVLYERVGNFYKSYISVIMALEYYKKVREIFKELYKEKPENIDIKRGLAISYEKLGDIYKSIGDTKQALEFYQKDNKLMQELYKENPENIDIKNGLAISYGRLFELYFYKQKYCQKAKEYLDLAYTLFSELVRDFSQYKEVRDNFEIAKEAKEIIKKECEKNKIGF